MVFGRILSNLAVVGGLAVDVAFSLVDNRHVSMMSSRGSNMHVQALVSVEVVCLAVVTTLVV